MTSGLRSLAAGRPAPRRQSGFTLIELILVITIVSLLGVAAIERLLYYQERAEKVAMDATLSALKMGLQIRLAELIITNRQAAAVELEQDNPTRWLEEPPANYAGSYRERPAPGYWYFAESARQLVYVPNSANHLQVGQPGSKELRFQVRLRYDDIDAALKPRSLSGVAILPLQRYQWF